MTVGARAQAPNAPGKRISVSVDAGKTSAPISPYLYGQFIDVRGRVANLWRPIGPDPSVAMDRKLPHVGDHTPRVSLAIAARSPRMIGILANVHSNRESV